MVYKHVKQLKVWVHDKAVGTLKYNNDKSVEFKYYKNVPKSMFISVAIPVCQKVYKWKDGLPALLGQHLPQGVTRYNIEESFYKFLDVDNLTDMDFLSITGLNQCGRLSFTDESIKLLPKLNSFHIDRKEIESSKNGQMTFNQYACQPRLHGEYSGIAGAIQKMVGTDVEKMFNIGMRSGRTLIHSDVILKSTHHYEATMSINEKTCMGISKACGFQTSACRQSKDGSLLLIKRFDRFKGHKLGFEDFSGLASNSPILNGAQSNGSYANILQSITRMAKTLSLTKGCFSKLQKDAFRRIVLSNLVRDSDMHLKNIGVLYSDKKIKISPVYDVVCTDVLNFYGMESVSHMCLPWESNSDNNQWKTIDELIDFGCKYTFMSKQDIQSEVHYIAKNMMNWCCDVSKDPENKVELNISRCIGYYLTSMNNTLTNQWSIERSSEINEVREHDMFASCS